MEMKHTRCNPALEVLVRIWMRYQRVQRIPYHPPDSKVTCADRIPQDEKLARVLGGDLEVYEGARKQQMSEVLALTYVTGDMILKLIAST
jgi:hypothetical protein